MVLERVWGPIGRSADGVLINQPQQGILIVTNVRDPELSMGILYDQSHFGNREKHEIPELFHVHVGASLQSVPPTRDSKGHTEALRLHRSPESPAHGLRYYYALNRLAWPYQILGVILDGENSPCTTWSALY